jgi:hypothetical protein
MRDGLDASYFHSLSALFSALESRYGEALWWASMDEIATRYRKQEILRGESNVDPEHSIGA